MSPAHAESKLSRTALAILLVGLALRLVVSWLDIAYLIDCHPNQVFLIDDTFISHGIARNLALGHGMSFDGVHATNGFQPLYVFLLVPLYALVPDDPVLPVHIALTGLAILNMLCGLMIYRTVRLFAAEDAATFGLGVWAFSPDVVRLGINGLETSLATFLIVCSLYFYLTRIRLSGSTEPRRFVGLGVLLGLATLARVDSVLFAVALGLDLLVLGIRRREPARFAGRTALAAAVALAILFPWLVASVRVGGSIVPMSGKAVRFAALDKFQHQLPDGYYAGNLLHSLATILESPALPGWRSFTGRDYHDPEWLAVALNLPLIALLAFVALRRGRSREAAAVKRRAPLDNLGFLVLYGLFCLAAYSFYVLGQWFYPRYYYSLTCLLVIFVAVCMGRLAEATEQRRSAAVVAAVAFVAVLGIGYGLQWWSIAGKQSGCGYYNLATWVGSNVPRHMKVGAFQSGTLGYFLEHQVVNLDGVVNPAALEALEREEMFDYVKQERIDIIADWNWVINVSLVRNSRRNPDLHLVATPCGSSVYQVR